jgi:hypothetical protein
MRAPSTASRRSSRALGAAAFALGLLASGRALAVGPDGLTTAPQARPTLLWFVAQLVPSPEIVVLQGAHPGMRWEVTPLLYSFGMDRRVSPWRSFVVEPILRESGSIEIYASPEYLALGQPLGSTWTAHGGVRTYLPILEKGEALSVSLGGSAFQLLGRGALAYEVGAYGLNGVFGLQVAVVPADIVRSMFFTLSVRYF